ncbi:alpha/beta hydrolase [Pontibacter sp. 172403-2]|nr:alpha/beta hydrolase [Pontibacter sp. 172403-2]
MLGANGKQKTKDGWHRVVQVLAMACIVTMISACNNDDEIDIEPNGPQPEWGPNIEPQMLAVIEKLDSLVGQPPLYERTAEEARMAPTPKDAVLAVMEDNGIPMPPSKVDTTGQEIAVEGGTIHVRIYTPKNATAPYPGIVYYHGGGWVIASIDAYDASARALSEKTGAVVVSVGYRQAPEYKFPTAHNDSFAAYKWVLSNASSLNIDGTRVAVAGESAGGNLAAAMCLMARDQNVQMPVHQLLVYPIAGYDFNTPSYIKYAKAHPLSKSLMQWFFDKYLRSPEDGDNPLISLVQATDLASLPPATVINAQLDPLQSEGQEYADHLEAAGVAVTAQVYEGVTHEFFGMATVVPEAKEAQELAARELKEAFEK